LFPWPPLALDFSSLDRFDYQHRFGVGNGAVTL